MSPTRRAEHRAWRTNRDRLMQRLELPEDERATAIESICFAVACFALVLVTLWAAVN
jgi:hypothetical protein